MDIISTSRILPPQRRMQSFNFVESFKNPWDKPGHEQPTGEWHCFSNSTVEHDFYKNASLAWREMHSRE